MVKQMDSEIGSTDMADDNMRVDDAILSFSGVIDSAIRSDTASDEGASRVHSFASLIDLAIRSDTASNSGASSLAHGFASTENLRSTVAPRSSKLKVVSNNEQHNPARFFTLAKLKEATNDFSHDNIISVGRFCVVYRGKLSDREVAIKRAELWWSNTSLSPIFSSQLALLPRLHYKRLIWLVGFCEEKDERLVVYDYVKNESLHHHLDDKRSSVLNSWKMSMNTATRLFKLAELEEATNNFSIDNKIGAGRFGDVYRGKLVDGRVVAIKRGKTCSGVYRGKLVDGRVVAIKRGETCSGVKCKLAILSRLDHKNLVGLVGYCEEYSDHQEHLVYEYMTNGTLSKHLHDKDSSVLNNWRMRINIALDASRGIEYIHNGAYPCIIHRRIKSSNILLDDTWTARVSNVELLFMNPERPEYYFQNTYSKKSNVYELGVVLLELLTGKRATKYGEDGELVNFAVPFILDGELVNVLDPRVASPRENEEEAVKLVANTAIKCVDLKQKDKPTVTDIVVNLERALAMCGSSPYHSDSSGSVSHVLE